MAVEKKTLNFRPGDWDYLTSVFSHSGVPTSQVIRRLVSNYVDELKKQENPENIEVDLKL